MEMFYILIIHGLCECLHLSKLIKLYMSYLCISLYINYTYIIKKLLYFS